MVIVVSFQSHQGCAIILRDICFIFAFRSTEKRCNAAIFLCRFSPDLAINQMLAPAPQAFGQDLTRNPPALLLERKTR